MIEKIKSIIESIDFVMRYPVWVRWAFGIWCLGGLVVLVAMVALRPKESAVRIVGLTRVANGLEGVTLQVRLENASDQGVALIALQLTFYAQKVPPGAGALQAGDHISGKYTVVGDAGKGELSTRVTAESEPLPATIDFPIKARPDYALVTLDLAQKVEAKGTDRFQVDLRTAGLPPAGAKFVQAVLVYSDDARSNAKEIPLE